MVKSSIKRWWLPIIPEIFELIKKGGTYVEPCIPKNNVRIKGTL